MHGQLYNNRLVHVFYKQKKQNKRDAIFVTELSCCVRVQQ